LGQRGAVLLLYLLGALSGASAILVCYITTSAALVFAAVVVATMLFAIAMLERAPYERQMAKPTSL
jgi:TRAP-type mannitol/chloroaromatic compound transport system permease large subunit